MRRLTGPLLAAVVVALGASILAAGGVFGQAKVQPGTVKPIDKVTIVTTAKLQAAIGISPDEGKIFGGTPLKLSVTVKNVGAAASAAGTFRVVLDWSLTSGLRDDPLNKDKGLVFATESKALPALQPGKSVTIDFAKEHKYPGPIAFVNDSWAFRDYQVEATFGKTKHILGTRSIGMVAYFGPNQAKELATNVPSEKPAPGTILIVPKPKIDLKKLPIKVNP